MLSQLAPSAPRNLLAADPLLDNATDIFTPGQWAAKRENLRRSLLGLMGRPSRAASPDPAYTLLEESRRERFRQLKISYFTEPGEEVRAWLLLPHEPNGAAVLCLHGTSPTAKETQIGIGHKPNNDLARHLADHGFITLAPDHVCSGERLPEGEGRYDTRTFYQRHPEWSAAGKAIWDGSRALDILQTVEGVNADRLGCVGHSLGGQGTLFLMAFDERVRAGVCSAGFSPWEGNPQRGQWCRDEWYRYLPNLRDIFREQDENGGMLPVEMYEFAALIAPRAFLNLSGLADHCFGNNAMIPEMALQLDAVWSLLGEPERFSQLLMGGGHAVHHYSRAALRGWLEQWLVNTNNHDSV